MKAKLILTFLLVLGGVFSSIQSTFAEPIDRVEVKLIEAMMKKNEELAQSYLTERVKIQRLKDNKPIRGYVILPTPKKGVSVLVAHNRESGSLGGCESKVITLIWELTVKNNQITNINVIF
jgi:hypothetical protein